MTETPRHGDRGEVVANRLKPNAAPTLPAPARCAVSLQDLLRPRRPGDVGLADPVPAIRLENWHAMARQHISVDNCLSLARHGFKDLAAELMRQRGDLL